jgi:prevent-host-death family protein
MATKTIELSEAQIHLKELIVQVQAGTEIILTEGNTPIARLTAIAPAPPARRAGLHPTAIWTSEDFDAPLPEEFWTSNP